MSTFSARNLEIWKSSLGKELTPLDGVFAIEVKPSLMVSQSIQYLKELSNSSAQNLLLKRFINGMKWWDQNRHQNIIFWHYNFKNKQEFGDFTPEVIIEELEQLELNLDISLFWNQITYLGEFGRGPEKPLIQIVRNNLIRAMAFEVEERGKVTKALNENPIKLSIKAKIALSHYKTGMALLTEEDKLPGLIDGAFMQFYQAIEVLTEEHSNKNDKAIKKGESLYGKDFPSEVLRHIFKARNIYFAHSKSSNAEIKKAQKNLNTAFDIAKQVLVVRWCAKKLLSIETGVDLVIREMRLYPSLKQSIYFSGRLEELKGDFALP